MLEASFDVNQYNNTTLVLALLTKWETYKYQRENQREVTKAVKTCRFKFKITFYYKEWNLQVAYLQCNS